ncbi:MAG: c-type cytochrome biogenesis protein CcsB [Actinomycetota bacterium]|jgi:cytochrome c-type biogenesis protein CcsB|nr:c-type cytochrome biogenesis protein CcsB [Actinomycetota bacterium]
MVNESLAQTSNTLFNVAFVGYIVAMVAYFFRLAFTQVTAENQVAGTAAGRRVGLTGTVLASAAWLVHLGSVVTRGMAAGRVPWANMYEYSSILALGAVIVGLVVVQRRFGYGHLVGFVLAAAVLSMTTGLLLFTEAGPVVPALNSYWIKIHVAAMMSASSIFIVGFVATVLYLVKDTAERRTADRSGSAFSGSTVGAAQAQAPADARPEGYEADAGAPGGPAVAGPLVQREALSPLLFPLVPAAVVAAFVLIVWRTPGIAIVAASVAALLGTASWYAVPYLPPAARLDNLAYRTIAFAFPVLTFGVMAGAIWAEESWGRYWGWDPKETGSFFTWVLYAAYLHARSTHGWRGRRAGWIGGIAFVALMITYYAVNLWIVGLHSYAGV